MAQLKPTNPQLTALILKAAKGLSIEEVAGELGISRRAVERRLERLYTTIGAVNESHALWIVFQSGYISPTLQ